MRQDQRAAGAKVGAQGAQIGRAGGGIGQIGGLATGELRIRCAAGQFLRDLASFSKDQKGHGYSCNSGQL